MQCYADKKPSYFGKARKDIAPLLPVRAANVLEIGCGSGATLAWLKSTGRFRSTTGIELFQAAADQARQCVDRVLCGPAEDIVDRLPAEERFDLVLCLDVLEHMVDPWAFLDLLQSRLTPGGLLIASLPNVRYVGVLVPLMFRDQWRYRDEGVLDRTHLRFFTRSSAIELVKSCGLHLTDYVANVPARGTLLGRLNRYTLGLFTEFFAFQYVIAARKPGTAS